MLLFLLFAEILASKEQVTFATTVVDLGNSLTVLSSGTVLQRAKDETHAQLIVGGNNADRGEYPWLITMNYNDRFWCGGSILDEETILTAAHCVLNDPRQRRGDFSIKAGDYKTNKTENTEQVRRVKRVIIHPKYNSNTFNRDVAILKLATPLQLNKYIQKIQIASKAREKKLLSSPVCFVAGIGDSVGDGTKPSRTKEARAAMRSRNDCEKLADNGFGRTYTRYMICSLDILKGSCYGDSGGPLTCYDNNDNPYLVGAISWGSINCWRGYNVYARVSYFKAWAKQYLM